MTTLGIVGLILALILLWAAIKNRNPLDALKAVAAGDLTIFKAGAE